VLLVNKIFLFLSVSNVNTKVAARFEDQTSCYFAAYCTLLIL